MPEKNQSSQPTNGNEAVPVTGAPDGQMTPLEIHQKSGFVPPDEPGKKLEKQEPQKQDVEQHAPKGRERHVDQGGVD